ncbi:histone deacetylase 3-like protein [Gigaspora rosea]|uniref:Histone deacetylase n=1 Tax=Gigaspora rosea TaxID=44941 RepID=A0A397UKL2_9GLOM|nr:histone deacetylase 3-like protein [Gigaspora rosea]
MDSTFFDSSCYNLRPQSVTSHVRSHCKKRISYFHNNEIGNFQFGVQHPMKPLRLSYTNDLVCAYRLHEKMRVFCPPKATDHDLMEFHIPSYITFLKNVTPENSEQYSFDADRFNISEDCPIFRGLYDFCQIYAGASVAAALRLTSEDTDICINWSGGLHHAKHNEASGFCFVNDIVLAIQQLLRVFPRVLYIDIDIHHGDGVQEAFYETDRCMTVSFHKYKENGKYFPGTGGLGEIGIGLGKRYCLNVPLKDGMDDESYVALFKDVISDVKDRYQPNAVVLQSGADSLGKDKLGGFNLSIKAHGECVRFVKNWQIPLLVLGGGGYKIENVARCWAYETSILVDAEVPEALPKNAQFYNFFGPDYSLHPPLVRRIENLNTKADLQKLSQQVHERLRLLDGAPSVQLHEFSKDLQDLWEESEEEMRDYQEDAIPDIRPRRRLMLGENEFYDRGSDHDNDDQLVDEDQTMDYVVDNESY